MLDSHDRNRLREAEMNCEIESIESISIEARLIKVAWAQAWIINTMDDRMTELEFHVLNPTLNSDGTLKEIK